MLALCIGRVNVDDGLVFTCRKGELFKVPSLYVDWIPEKTMLIKVAQCDSWIVRFRLNVFPHLLILRHL